MIPAEQFVVQPLIVKQELPRLRKNTVAWHETKSTVKLYVDVYSQMAKLLSVNVEPSLEHTIFVSPFEKAKYNTNELVEFHGNVAGPHGQQH